MGLAKNQIPVLGAMYFPALNLMIYANHSKGAYCNENKIHVSDLNLIEGSYSIPTYSYQGIVQADQNFMDQMKTSKIHNCTTYDFACLSQGKTELILSGTLGPWDSCAGVCIVREAGGVVLDENGNDWKVSSNLMIASNKKSKELLELIKSTNVNSLNRSFLIPELEKDNKQDNLSKNLEH